MAKKYLLYIHNERFAAEEKKSELEDFYALEASTIGPKIKSIPKVIKTKEDAQKAVEELCNGHDSMRFNCSRKGCKYA